MNARPHVLVGAGCAKGGLLLAGQVTVAKGHLPNGLLSELPMIGAAGFAALWPDGDSPTSTVGRWLPGWRVYGKDGYEGRSLFGLKVWHRHRWHSIGALGIVAMLAFLSAALLGGAWWGVAAGVVIGYASHLVGDLPFGRQMLAWPFSSELVGLRTLGDMAWRKGRGRRRGRSPAARPGNATRRLG